MKLKFVIDDHPNLKILRVTGENHDLTDREEQMGKLIYNPKDNVFHLSSNVSFYDLPLDEQWQILDFVKAIPQPPLEFID